MWDSWCQICCISMCELHKVDPSKHSSLQHPSIPLPSKHISLQPPRLPLSSPHTHSSRSAPHHPSHTPLQQHRAGGKRKKGRESHILFSHLFHRVHHLLTDIYACWTNTHTHTHTHAHTHSQELKRTHV